MLIYDLYKYKLFIKLNIKALRLILLMFLRKCFTCSEKNSYSDDEYDRPTKSIVRDEIAGRKSRGSYLVQCIFKYIQSGWLQKRLHGNTCTQREL